MLCIFLRSRGWSVGGSSWLLMRVRDMCSVFDVWIIISEFSRGILGYTLFEYLELRLACFIHKIGLVGVLSYLSFLFVLGRSTRHRYITMSRPAPSTSLRCDSTVYWGIRLCLHCFKFQCKMITYEVGIWLPTC
jgi:hypothetical protein